MKGQHGHHRSRPNPAAAAAGSPDLGPACLPMPKRSRELVPLHQVGPSSVLSVASQDGTLRYVPPKVTVDEVLLQEELRADELKRRAVFRTMVVLMILAGLAVVIVVAFGSDGQFEWEELFGMRQLKMRSFLHISDASADPLYDYRYYDASSSSSLPGGSGLARDPALAKTCPFDSESAVLARWNRTGDATCPCGFFGADPPFSLLASLRQAITEAKPEFVAWSGGFAAPGLPGSAAAAASSSSSHSTDILSAAACATTKATIKAAIAAVSAQGVRVEGSNGATGGIANVYTWSASDVVPAGAPLSQAWLEDLGVFLLERNWLKRHEMDDWNRGGFYLRNLGDGLCVIVLNSLGWTAGHVNEHHAAAQLDWFKHDVWRRDTSCERFLVHAGVPLDATSEVNKAEAYRLVLQTHRKLIVAELFGHTTPSKAVRLENRVPAAPVVDGLAYGSTDGSIAFAAPSISRRDKTDPAFQRLTLDAISLAIQDVEGFSMKRPCAFSPTYRFKRLFEPYFDQGITLKTLSMLTGHKAMLGRLEDRITANSMPFTEANLSDPAFVRGVRQGLVGCSGEA